MSVETMKARLEALEAWKKREQLGQEADQRAKLGPVTRNVARGIICKMSR